MSIRNWLVLSRLAAAGSALTSTPLGLGCSKTQDSGGAGAPSAPSPAQAGSATAPQGSAQPGATRAAEKRAGAATYDEADREITAKVGSRFAILLPANITAPMKWRIDPEPEPAVLTKVGESYADQPPPDCEGCTGYAGTRRFDFEAKQPAKLKLRFFYRPLSEPQGKAEKEVSFEVTLTE